MWSFRRDVKRVCSSYHVLISNRDKLYSFLVTVLEKQTQSLGTGRDSWLTSLFHSFFCSEEEEARRPDGAYYSQVPQRCLVCKGKPTPMNWTCSTNNVCSPMETRRQMLAWNSCGSVLCALRFRLTSDCSWTFYKYD